MIQSLDEFKMLKKQLRRLRGFIAMFTIGITLIRIPFANN